jgi:hypothetical protein
MPIFMDRHEAAGVTQAQAAEMHLRDLAVQERYGVRFLTYWFEEERGSAFCLIEAPDAETAQAAHRGSHGELASEIIEVDRSAVEAFLGRIHDPRPAAAGQPAAVEGGFRAVLFTDIVGSTEMTARLGDQLATEAVRAHDSLVRRALRHRHLLERQTARPAQLVTDDGVHGRALPRPSLAGLRARRNASAAARRPRAALSATPACSTRPAARSP